MERAHKNIDAKAKIATDNDAGDEGDDEIGYDDGDETKYNLNTWCDLC